MTLNIKELQAARYHVENDLEYWLKHKLSGGNFWKALALSGVQVLQSVRAELDSRE